MPNLHFFSSRRDGMPLPASKSSWRIGQGNVFVPPAQHSDYTKSLEDNTIQTIEAILHDKGFEYRHPGVLLSSQYKEQIVDVDDTCLSDPNAKRDSNGRIIINADGLFTQLKNVPLLNKSGDAHAIIFESEQAVGILVGAWRCLGKNIVQLMVDKFKVANIPLEEVTVRVGPGLSQESYAIGDLPHQELQKVYGDVLEHAVERRENSRGKTKYHLNVPGLMQKYAEIFHFNVDVSEAVSTFDKAEWKAVKAKAHAEKNPELPIHHYANRMFFGARLYVRCDREARRVAIHANQAQPEQLAVLAPDVNPSDLSKAGTQGRYNETGRCLNGVMRR